MPALLISVRFHEGRYHGQPDWPPSPARLFQALVAGAAQGETLADDDKHAFSWLETLTAPVIAAPAMRRAQGFRNFVPNNDLDAVGGDPKRIGEIRAPKPVRPVLFDAETPLVYVWIYDEAPETHENACRIRAIAERLYQFGRGVDMAWAWGETLPAEEAEARLAAHPGAIHRPSKSGDGTPLEVPRKGSLESLIVRHTKARMRFQTRYEFKPSKKEPDRKVATGQVFTQPPKARFARIPYDCPPARLLFDLRTTDEKAEFATWPLTGAAALVERVRDAAAWKLSDASPGNAAAIERVFIGRHASDADKDRRLRILPLPSIGGPHTERSIRRILIEIPPDCPLPQGDVAWAFSGLDHDPATGEVGGWALVPAEDRRMLRHYGVVSNRRDAFRLWRTVTPAALPERAARRRIDPKRRRAEAKAATERADGEGRAAGAVLQALRHARIAARVEAIRVQREPFEARGARAEPFAPGTRFAKERLWHVEVAFAEATRGPIVIGDGRYLGLGVMAPAPDERPPALHVFAIDPAEAPPAATAEAVARALRRAVMSRVQAVQPSGEALPTFFSGHAGDGAAARSGRHEHLFFLADDADGDGKLERVAVVAPHLVDRTTSTGDLAVERRRLRRHLQRLDLALDGFRQLRAGQAGAPRLARAPAPDDTDPAFGRSKVWVSRTPYRVTRHPRARDDLAEAVRQDLIQECLRRGLPRPEVRIVEMMQGPRGGLAAHALLTFAVAVRGPILLGAGSHFGSGLFVAAP